MKKYISWFSHLCSAYLDKRFVWNIHCKLEYGDYLWNMFNDQQVNGNYKATFKQESACWTNTLLIFIPDHMCIANSLCLLHFPEQVQLMHVVDLLFPLIYFRTFKDYRSLKIRLLEFWILSLFYFHKQYIFVLVSAELENVIRSYSIKYS